MDWILNNLPFLVSLIFGAIGFAWGLMSQMGALKAKQSSQGANIEEIAKVLEALRESHTANSERIVKLEMSQSTQEKAMNALIEKIDDLISTLTDVRMTIERNGLQ